MTLLPKTPGNLACHMMMNTEYYSISYDTHVILNRVTDIKPGLYLTRQKNYLLEHNMLTKIIFLVQLPNNMLCKLQTTKKFAKFSTVN